MRRKIMSSLEMCMCEGHIKYVLRLDILVERRNFKVDSSNCKADKLLFMNFADMHI